MKKSTEIKAGSLSWRLFSRLLSAGSLCPSPLARATQRWTCSHTIKQVACSLLHYLCLGLCLGIKFYDTWKKWFNRTGAKLNVRGSVFPEYYWTSPKQELKRNYFFRFFFLPRFLCNSFPFGWNAPSVFFSAQADILRTVADVCTQSELRDVRKADFPT